MDLNKLKMLGEWVLLEMDQATRRKLIAIPDSFQKASPTARVLKVGPKVPEAIKPGDFVILKSFNKWKKSHGITDAKTNTLCYIAPWSDVEARLFEGRVIPVGRRILVQRLMSSSNPSNLIVSRDHNKENIQGLDVQVERLGLTVGPEFRDRGIRPGMKGRLKNWEMHMTELDVNGKFCLIVNEDDIILEYES